MGVRTVELFAGVGGFRLGLEAASPLFETVWFNQWEPGNKAQHAWTQYVKRFCTERGEPVPDQSNTDVALVGAEAVPQHDLLVGGFPCQDYSVATTLDKAGGLQGRKGVLWWQIVRLLERKPRPTYLILENVDRLLKSPASKRGRDFGILLWCLNDLGYNVEWRVINAADYGNRQRRRRTFIFAARKKTGIGKHIAAAGADADYLYSTGFFAGKFPTKCAQVPDAPEFVSLPAGLRETSEGFEYLFQNSGVMANGSFATRRVEPDGPGPTLLGPVLAKQGVPDSYYLEESCLQAWKDVKGSKREKRTAKNGFEYHFSEGRMQFPDLATTPARTVLTSEGNRTPNRSTHVIQEADGRHRFLTPVEVEQVMGFPKNWTEGLPDRWRYFTMGNALVPQVVTDIGNRLTEWIKLHEAKDEVARLLGETKRETVQRSIRRNPATTRGNPGAAKRRRTP